LHAEGDHRTGRAGRQPPSEKAASVNETYGTASVDTRCGDCRRPIFWCNKSLSMKHWAPEHDADHQAVIAMPAPAVHDVGKRWYQ
jgi:hypothetical protein